MRDDARVRRRGTRSKRTGSCACSGEAGRWGNRHHDASTPIIAKYTKLPVATVAKMHRGAFAESTNVALLQPVVDATLKYGMIAKAFPASELFYRR